MSNQTGTILVIGATGTQGGATARHLLAAGWHVRALTRDASGEGAGRLKELGAEVVEGDMDDRASLELAMKGVHGVFSVQNFWGIGAEKEIEQGIRVADVAKDAGVEHFIYSSVGGAERSTGIPHFDSKWRIEEHIREIGLPATILRPVFFMENWNGMFRPEPDSETATLALGMKADRPLQMIAADDIGAFAAIAFAHPETFIGQAIELAGDDLTMPEAAEILGRDSGKSVSYQEIPIDQLRAHNEEMAVMFDWFNREGYRADIDALRAIHPGLQGFERWVARRHDRLGEG